jgi:antitoxin ParD1/3/4
VGDLWDAGIASGRAEPGTTMADIKREARSRRSLS